MRAILLLAAIARGVHAAPADEGWQWRETLTVHFKIMHQETFLPPGFTMSLERIDARLHRDLGSFMNWDQAGRATVYLYQDQRSYASGQFKPPPWSNGVAIYDQKTIAIPTMKTTAQMLHVLAHENTHLIFVNYFREGGHRDPPSWVNEGLAMLEEADSPEKPETSQWYQSMVMTNSKSWFPLEKFFSLSPTADLKNDQKLIQVFYVQAYSITQFLVRKHAPMQFKAFCDRLKAGDSVADALRLAYQYRSIGDFEGAWRAWLNKPEHRRRVDALPLADRVQDDGVIDQAGAGGMRGGRGGGSGFNSGFSSWQVTTPSVFGKPLPKPTFPSSNEAGQTQTP